MSKMIEDRTLLARKQRIDAERKADAIARKAQRDLRDTTPGIANPASVMAYLSRHAVGQ